MTYCYYHNDADGKCAATIVRLAHPEVQLIPVESINLSNLPHLDMNKSDIVIIVDISTSYNSLQKLLDTVKEVTWIDHHKTSLNTLDQILGGPDRFEHLNVVHKIGEGGACLLTWKYYHENQVVPAPVQLISDYDEWKYKYGDDTMLFHLGFSTLEADPSSPWWDYFLNSKETELEIQRLIMKGIPILHYQEVRARDLLRNYAFKVKFENTSFICINTDTQNVALRKMSYTDIYPDTEGMILFSKQSNKWVVSLYTDNGAVDVSTIAIKYGGGGHKAAAGFSTDTLPF